jgi:adsorption protein A
LGWGDGRYVEVFARGFQTLDSDSGPTGPDSRQGGLGLRWKPLREHNAVLAVSRVAGRRQDDDWLLQAAYSRDAGTDLRIDTDRWWSTRLYAEAGRYLEAGRTYGVGQAQAGRSWRAGPSGRTTVFPHVALVADYDSAAVRRTSAGVGPGVTVRHWFREDRYAAPRSSIEFTLQYRVGVHGDDRTRGWFVGTVLSY